MLLSLHLFKKFMPKKANLLRPAPLKSDYGLDAPPVIRNLIIAGLACIILGVLLRIVFAVAQPRLARIFLIVGLLSAACFLATVALMVWSSKVGKIQFREQLIDSLHLSGTETVLDVGCGRGLLLTAAARRLPAGKALGIDLWQSADQSGNNPETTLRNAQAEGVAGRVEVKTGDMRALPFEDQAIDAVVSSIAIHNIPDKAGRAQAIREIIRVLKPDGQVALVDFECTDEYIQVLHASGWMDVKLSGLQFQIFPPVRVLTGRKPSPK
jgi:ubiquinone/menaquinone biosynthesis C-methylase UbiE